MATSFDPNVIQEFADRLYKKANSTIASYTLAGLLIGGVIGAGLSHNSGSSAGIIPVALIFGGIGYAIGKEKAFQFKLQAQTAFCQVKIEENSRNSLARISG
jgi:hypothetical protein